MDAVWQELIRAVPWGAVIIILRWLDIKEKTEERRERDINAKDIAQQNRDNQIVVGKAYADAINNLASIVADTKNTVIEQYKNIGITQDLIDIAKENMRSMTDKDRGK